MTVYQDGQDFYSGESGLLIYRSVVMVKDFELYSAQTARREFKEWAKNHLQGEPEFLDEKKGKL